MLKKISNCLGQVKRVKDGGWIEGQHLRSQGHFQCLLTWASPEEPFLTTKNLKFQWDYWGGGGFRHWVVSWWFWEMEKRKVRETCQYNGHTAGIVDEGTLVIDLRSPHQDGVVQEFIDTLQVDQEELKVSVPQAYQWDELSTGGQRTP